MKRGEKNDNGKSLLVRKKSMGVVESVWQSPLRFD
jgi:hypothetical protein